MTSLKNHNRNKNLRKKSISKTINQIQTPTIYRAKLKVFTNPNLVEMYFRKSASNYSQTPSLQTQRLVLICIAVKVVAVFLLIEDSLQMTLASSLLSLQDRYTCLERVENSPMDPRTKQRPNSLIFSVIVRQVSTIQVSRSSFLNNLQQQMSS